MKRRIISITLMCSLVLTFTACAIIKASPPTPTPVTITFVFINDIAKYQPLADQFHQLYPHITVKLEPLRSDRRLDEVLSDVENADAVRINTFFLNIEFLDKFMPIDNIVTTDPNFPKDDFISGSLQALQYKGVQLGIPAGVDPQVVFYEPKRFEMAGVTPPSADWTVDDLVETALRLDAQDPSLREKGLFVYGFCSSVQSTDPLFFVYIFGGKLFDQLPDATRPTLNDPANIEAVKWYASLALDYHILPPSEEHNYDMYRNISGSNCGYYLQWFDKLGYNLTGAFPSAMLPLPKLYDPFNISVLDGYFILKTSTHPQETWQWINFLVSQPDASGKQIPPLLKLINSDLYAKRVSTDALEIAKRITLNNVILGLESLQNQQMGQVIEIFNEAVAEVMTGKIEARTALDEAQKRAEDIFK